METSYLAAKFAKLTTVRKAGQDARMAASGFSDQIAIHTAECHSNLRRGSRWGARPRLKLANGALVFSTN